MNPIKFVKEHLDDVASAMVLAADDTSFLVGVVFTDGTRRLGIVYPPSKQYGGPWDMELGDEATHVTPREIRCKLEADTPSPIEEILKGDKDE